MQRPPQQANIQQVVCSRAPSRRLPFADEPPIITCPDGITVEQGTDQAITATATDFEDDDATLQVSCDPANTSALSGGTTTVTCTATDSAGNTATCDVEVTVTEPRSALHTGGATMPALLPRWRVHSHGCRGCAAAFRCDGAILAVGLLPTVVEAVARAYCMAPCPPNRHVTHMFRETSPAAHGVVRSTYALQTIHVTMNAP